jgi:plastocyanin
LLMPGIVLLGACASIDTPRPEPFPAPSTETPADAESEPDVSPPEPASPTAVEPEPTEKKSDPDTPVETAEQAATETPSKDAEATEPEPASDELTPAKPESQTAQDTPAPPPPKAVTETSPDRNDEPKLNRRIEGRINVLRNGREQRFAATYLDQTVVAWRPDQDIEFAPMDEQQVVTRDSRFYPQTLAVTSGTRVRFPNLDDIRHNVFSNSAGHRFDVGIYGPDEGAATRFDGAGMVEIYCNIHPNMAAFMLVLDTPHFTSPDEDGNFRLGGLPPGPGELQVWNYRAEQRLTTRRLRDSNRLGEVVEMAIDITRPAVPQHTTKDGRPYHRRDQ